MYLGDERYGKDGTINHYKPGLWKCSKFLADVWEEGAGVRIPRKFRFKFWKEHFPLQPHDWAVERVPHFPFVRQGKLQTGDVVIYPNTAPGGLGHMGMYLYNGMIIQAGKECVCISPITYHPNWRKMVVRRYSEIPFGFGF